MNIEPSGESCPLCRGDSLVSRIVFAHDTDAPFEMTVLQCASCEFAWQWPLMLGTNESIEYFEKKYATAENGSYYDKTKKREICALQMEFVNSLLAKRGSLLDVGSGDGTFADITEFAFVGRANMRSAMSVACADVDGDGWLDIYIGNLAEDEFRGMHVPYQAGHFNVLYRNNGDLTFTDVTAAAGVQGPQVSMRDAQGQPILYEDPVTGEMYEGYDFSVPVAPFDAAPPEATLGDCWSRYYVRMMEVVQAIKLIRQGIEKYRAAEGPFRLPHKLSAKLPADEVYLETECPAGQKKSGSCQKQPDPPYERRNGEISKVVQ